MQFSAGEWEGFIESAVRSGRFRSAEDVLIEGLRLVREREARVTALRGMLDASITEGGSITDEALGTALAARAAELDQAGFE